MGWEILVKAYDYVCEIWDIWARNGGDCTASEGRHIGLVYAFWIRK